MTETTATPAADETTRPATWHVADVAFPVLVTGPAEWDEDEGASLVTVRHDESRDDEGAVALWRAVGFPTRVRASEIRYSA